MIELKTLAFPNTAGGQQQKVKVLTQYLEAGWSITSETITPAKVAGCSGCCAGGGIHGSDAWDATINVNLQRESSTITEQQRAVDASLPKDAFFKHSDPIRDARNAIYGKIIMWCVGLLILSVIGINLLDLIQGRTSSPSKTKGTKSSISKPNNPSTTNAKHPNAIEESAYSLNEKGVSYRNKKQRGMAVEYFRKAHDAEPTNKQYLINLALALYFTKDYKSSLQYADKYLQMEPSGHAFNIKGHNLLELERRDEAILALQEGCQRLDSDACQKLKELGVKRIN